MKIKNLNNNLIPLFTVFLLITILLLTPSFSFAQLPGGASEQPPQIRLSLSDLANKIAQVVWVVFATIAVIMFVVAGILFLTAGGNPDKVATARNAFIWGVVGVVVGVIAFTIIWLVQQVFL